ncbi:MAG: nitroreductase family protein [Isosphaeraceae bacterium]
MNEPAHPPTAPLPAPEAIRRRRATRRFDPSRPLDDTLLVQLLTLATHAPSAYNLQPWRFLVVRSEANRQRLRTAAYNQPKITEAPAVVIVLGYHTPERSHLDVVVDDMTTRGVVSREGAAEFRGRLTSGLRRLPEAVRPLWVTRSTMLAAATLMIAAESLGVASAPMEGFDADRVKLEFGIPEDHTVCCLVALGFAAEQKPFPGRLGLTEVCYAEHFGQPWTGGDRAHG